MYVYYIYTCIYVYRYIHISTYIVVFGRAGNKLVTEIAKMEYGVIKNDMRGHEDESYKVQWD